MNLVQMNFLGEFLKVVDENISNNYKDNWDYHRFGPAPKISFKQKTKESIKKWLNNKGFFNLRNFVKVELDDALKAKYLFDNLETIEDKKLLLQVLAYRTMGFRKVKLPLNTTEYWDKLKSIEALCSKSDTLNPNFLHFFLHRINLNKIGYPIEFYFTASGIMIDFIVKQYEYKKKSTLIKVEEGDFVIDGGGCWGDTALYFANEAGDCGKIFSFEFIPNNIKIFEKNISLNANLKDNIELVKNPLWKDSTTRVYFKDFGPGSSVSMDSSVEYDGEVLTSSIDDLVVERGLNKIDFIKLDIEGAEMDALRGATQTIRKFKPKLAVAIYHSIDDFERIPKLVREILPEYKFYFSHCTIYGEESMLFAIADK